jgi:hypothetical protein
MFTILKVRESLASYDEDPGWYDDPPGTLSLPADERALRHNGISGDGATAPRAPANAMRSWEQAPVDQPAEPAGHGGHGGHGAGH